MAMKDYNRSTVHLGPHAGDYANRCFKAVEDLFEGSWLRKNNDHRLQILWSRRDHLATSELYALGKAILNLTPKHIRWLETTAKSVKKNSIDAHGFITEILVCGSTQEQGGSEVFPSKKSEPGVDLTVRFPSGFRHLISVKNHDISIHEKVFQKSCNFLKEVFVNRLKNLGKSGQLFVVCEDYMTKDDFVLCEEFVERQLNDVGIFQLKPNRLSIFFKEMAREPNREFAKSKTSSAVLIHCAQHPNEQLNFKDKLRKAAENMKKHVAKSDNCFRWLRMRVHASADILALEKVAQDMFDANTDCGLDGVILTQTTGVRDQADNNTMIHTVFRFAARSDHQGWIASAKRGEKLHYEFGIGSVGSAPIDTIFIIDDERKMTLSRDRYVYQKMDYYYLAKRDALGFYGDLESPASGVHFHLVADFNGSEVEFQSISPESEDVLIV